MMLLLVSSCFVGLIFGLQDWTIQVLGFTYETKAVGDAMSHLDPQKTRWSNKMEQSMVPHSTACHHKSMAYFAYHWLQDGFLLWFDLDFVVPVQRFVFPLLVYFIDHFIRSIYLIRWWWIVPALNSNVFSKYSCLILVVHPSRDGTDPSLIYLKCFDDLLIRWWCLGIH